MAKNDLSVHTDEQIKAAYWAWHDAVEQSRVRSWIDFADDKRNKIIGEMLRRGITVQPRGAKKEG